MLCGVGVCDCDFVGGVQWMDARCVAVAVAVKGAAIRRMAAPG